MIIVNIYLYQLYLLSRFFEVKARVEIVIEVNFKVACETGPVFLDTSVCGDVYVLFQFWVSFY